MLFRVYDNKEGKWVSHNSNIAISLNGEVQKNKFSKNKLLPESRYTYHMEIGAVDKNKVSIYEGDILKSDNDIVGLVAYAPEAASFLLLDYANEQYYSLGQSICSQLTIIGNIFENSELLGMRK